MQTNLIKNLLDQEELIWLQRARANLLLHGDRNTSFFHKVATAQKKRNCIKRLLDDTGLEGRYGRHQYYSLHSFIYGVFVF